MEDFKVKIIKDLVDKSDLNIYSIIGLVNLHFPNAVIEMKADPTKGENCFKTVITVDNTVDDNPKRYVQFDEDTSFESSTMGAFLKVYDRIHAVS